MFYIDVLLQLDFYLCVFDITSIMTSIINNHIKQVVFYTDALVNKSHGQTRDV